MAATNDWTRLRDLFDRAAPLNPHERARLLDGECADDPDLRQRVEEMLAAHDAAGGFLTAPTEPSPVPPGSLMQTLDADDLPPQRMVGPYKLLQKIGEGGFGVVYMAEQQAPIVRKVALKVIKPGMDTKQVIARFEAERQALALMDHPNIARIFDAGTTESGRPYFVMELVHGIPITEYCDRERLTTRQRLELFVSVCHAVAHAHQKGVIHRDLKPANVLITLHDGHPVPKVIDFGIARALHQRLTEHTVFTQYGQIIGTPEYMSPEQGEMSGLDIDTRSDVYSLGAVLYELLTGMKLFDPRQLRSLALREIQRVLREDEPPRPSARVSSLGASATEVARRHGVQAAQLVRMLRGDPDWIVVKAIAKDRRHRYDSAGALADDIGRYLRSEPVSATPPGLRYRATRFVMRHRVGVTVTAALAASLILGTALTTVGLVRARRAENAARREARLNALDAQALRAMLLEDEQGYLARVEESIALRRSQVPMDTLALANGMINTYGLLGALEFLGYRLSPRLDSLRTRLGADALDALLSIESPSRSTIDAFGAMWDEVPRRYPERLPEFLRRALVLRERAGEPDSALAADRGALATRLREIGSQELIAGRSELARGFLTEAVSQLNRAGADSRMDLADAKGELGACLTDLGQYPAAESLLIHAYGVSGAREHLMRLVRLYQRSDRADAARTCEGRTRVASIRELGRLAGVPTTTGRGGGNSGRLGDRWIWLFGAAIIRDTTLDRRSNVRWTSWSWTTDRDARDGIDLRHPVDSRGVPLELLSLTAAERAQRDTSSAWLAVGPGAMIEDPDRNRALVVYRKFLGMTRQGASLATWNHGEQVPRRVIVRPEAAEPTLLFQGDEPDLSEAAVALRDTLYLFGGPNQAGRRHEKIVARAPLARALDRTAWRFYAGDGRWSKEVGDAKVIARARVDFSVHWNPWLRKFVLVGMAHAGVPRDRRVIMMTSDRPEGPWSPPEVIYSAVRAQNPAYAGVFRPAIHPELSREGGRITYLTYESPMGFLDTELHVVEVVFK